MAQNCWRNGNTDDQADLSDTQDSDPAGTANDPSRANARPPSASLQLPAEQAPSMRSSCCTSLSALPDTVNSDTADSDPLGEMLVQQHLRRFASEEAKRSFEKITWRSGGQEGRRSSFLATATTKGVDADEQPALNHLRGSDQEATAQRL